MKSYRITLRAPGASARAVFGGNSGYAVDGRWHSKGHYLDYAAQGLSLAILERLVHYKTVQMLEPHVLCVIDVPEAVISKVGAPPAGWDDPSTLLPAAQALGNEWVTKQASPVLRVPSAIVPGEFNLMVNTRHEDWDWGWVVEGPVVFRFDARLVRLAKGRG